MKSIKIVNIILFGIAVVLTLNLIQPIGAITGNVNYNFDISRPQCYFYNYGEKNEIQIGRCCYEIQKQLVCKPDNTKEFDLKCYTSESSERHYSVNNKAFDYCKKEGYDIKIE